VVRPRHDTMPAVLPAAARPISVQIEIRKVECREAVMIQHPVCELGQHIAADAVLGNKDRPEPPAEEHFIESHSSIQAIASLASYAKECFESDKKCRIPCRASGSVSWLSSRRDRECRCPGHKVRSSS
jgi:hypothetical protein